MRDRVANRLRVSLTAALLLMAVGGCVRDDLAAPFRGNTDKLETTFDFAQEHGSARVLEETRRIDFGAKSAHHHLLSGWGEPEVDPTNGEPFIWATASEATLEVDLLRTTPTMLRFRCRPFAFEGVPSQRVDVLVNWVASGSVEMASGTHVYGVEIPSQALRPGRNVVTLRFAWAVEPRLRVPGSDDSRTLAAAFEAIWIGRSDTQAAEPDRVSRVEADALVLESGSALVYNVVPDGQVVLDPGAGADSNRLRIWLGEPGGDRRWIDWGRRGPRPVSIRWSAGSPLQVGFAAAAGKGEAAPVTVRPRALGTPVRTATSLLLVVMDTLRADFVGAYGGGVHTPVIDSLAAGGTLFERTYSHIAITGPSHASLFTSLLPFEHGVRNNAQVLGPSAVTMAENLRRRGWTTGAVVSLGVLKREFGFEQGFDVYGDDFAGDWMKDAGEVNADTLPLLSDVLVEPFFLWVHYSDPHEPYTPPNLDYPWVDLALDDRPAGAIRANGRSWTVPLTVEAGAHRLRFTVRRPKIDPGRWYRLDAVRIEGEDVSIGGGDWEVIEHPGSPITYQARLPAVLEIVNGSGSTRAAEIHLNFKQRLDIPEVRVRYAEEVEYADRQIGALLEAMRDRGLLDDTLVVFTSDHGEGLGYHNHVGHIHQVYDTLIRVPLILSQPGLVPAGLRVRDRVGLIDVYPTVAELLGVPGPDAASGASLVPLLRGEPMAPRDVIALTYRPEAFTDKQAIVRESFKYIHSWSPEREWEELYDVDHDPDELVDVLESRPEVAERLRSALAERLAEGPAGVAAEADLSEADRARLRALGYVH